MAEGPTVQLVVVSNGHVGSVRCVYLNDFRIAGGKPYVSENLPHKHWSVPISDIERAGFIQKRKGWVLVPEDVTAEMIEALGDIRPELGSTLSDNAERIWSALLGASPTPAVGQQESNGEKQ